MCPIQRKLIFQNYAAPFLEIESFLNGKCLVKVDELLQSSCALFLHKLKSSTNQSKYPYFSKSGQAIYQYHEAL